MQAFGIQGCRAHGLLNVRPVQAQCRKGKRFFARDARGHGKDGACLAIDSKHFFIGANFDLRLNDAEISIVPAIQSFRAGPPEIAPTNTLASLELHEKLALFSHRLCTLLWPIGNSSNCLAPALLFSVRQPLGQLLNSFCSTMLLCASYPILYV